MLRLVWMLKHKKEDFPFLRCVRGGVKMAIAILVNGRCAEVPDQGSSFAHLLLLQLQDGPHLCQGERQSVVCRPHHVTAPCCRIEEATVRVKVVMLFDLPRIFFLQPVADTYPFKAGIVIVLTWEEQKKALSYQIFRKKKTGKKFLRIASTASLTFTDELRGDTLLTTATTIPIKLKESDNRITG